MDVHLCIWLRKTQYWLDGWTQCNSLGVQCHKIVYMWHNFKTLLWMASIAWLCHKYSIFKSKKLNNWYCSSSMTDLCRCFDFEKNKKLQCKQIMCEFYRQTCNHIFKMILPASPQGSAAWRFCIPHKITYDRYYLKCLEKLLYNLPKCHIKSN